ncbi:MAG: glycosyltransferase family 39 protein [Acidobacteriota bacterium]|nr:glycosyltransferase family 39 protein [Acidobacteriota bacterium]
MLLVPCWLLDVSGVGAEFFANAGRGLLLVGLAALAGGLLLSAGGLRGSHPTARRRRLLLGLLVLALAVRLAGADFEVEERAYRDEGTYYHHASEINQGELLRWSFIYPHLLYYGYAFLLWLSQLFPGLWSSLCASIYGVTEPLARDWLTLRLAVAVLSAATVVPVFHLGRLLGGTHREQRTGELAGALGAALLIFSPAFNEGSHLIISDVPSACLATFCLLPVARLLYRERRRDYLAAGVFSGLAAAAKYPAGIVAVAIVAVWVYGRWRTRRFSFGLLWAGLASLAAFVAAMPSLLWAPGHALSGEGMLFGFVQYSQGGWIGVQPDSHLLFYGRQLTESFGWLAVLLGLAGLALLPRRRWSKVLWMLPFPVLYLGLITGMHMVVRRNLYPALPAMAMLLGLGLAVLVLRLRGWFQTRSGGRLRPATMVPTALVALTLVAPIHHTLVQSSGLVRASTRELAARWIEETLPPGAGIVREAYTPKLDPAQYAVWRLRFAAHIPPETLENGDQDFVLLAYNAYARFLDPANLTKEHHHLYAERYRRMLDSYPVVQEFRPSAGRRGPWLRLLKVPVEIPRQPRRQPLPAARAFVPDGSMAPQKEGAPVRYTRPGQWALLKTPLAAGEYRVRLDASSIEAGVEPELRLRTLGEATVEDAEPALGGWRFRLPAADKVLFYVYLPEGSELRGLVVIPAGG